MGGAERVATILANEWVAIREVIVITLFKADVFFELDSRVVHRSLGQAVGSRGIIKLLQTCRSLVRLRKLINAESPQVTLSFMNKYNALCLLALFGSEHRVVVSERDSPSEPLSSRRRWLCEALYPRAAGLIVQTQAQLHSFQSRLGKRPTRVIPNPITSFTVKPGLKENIILNVGRLVVKKGQADLIRAFARIDDHSWRLCFCGEGPARETLWQLASELGVEDRVIFAGRQQDLEPIFSRSSIFAFPSYWEGFPNALAEAMVAGLPCVSYDCPTGPADIIRSYHNGILVELGDLELFTSALKNLVASPQLRERLSKEALRTREMVNPSVIASQYLEFCLLAKEQY